MLHYYTAAILIIILSMAVIQLCIGKSNTLNKGRKLLFHWLFGAIALAAFCEWSGTFLDGRYPSLRVLHILAKATELSIAPIIGFIFAWIIEKKYIKPVTIFLSVHAILEFLSGIFGYIYYVDSNNVYHHSVLYEIYILAYIVSIIFAIVIVLHNVQKYQYTGMKFFLLIVFVLLVGIAIQLCFNSLKVGYIALGMTSIMLYVFTLEMIQQTDELTALLNRRGYENLIAHIDQKCMVIFFDVDNFKSVNDTYGHAYGDHALQEIGKAIKKTYAAHGKCFRYGGDEFTVILTKDLDDINILNHNFFETIETLRKIDNKIPSATIGYAIYDPDNQSIQDAVSEADTMVYRFKKLRKKKEQPQLGDQNKPKSINTAGKPDKTILTRQELELTFDNSLKNNDFIMYYQPKIDAKTGCVASAESLVRLKREDGTIIGPDAFICVYEEDGLIIQLDEYIFKQVCNFQKRRMELGKKLIPISVNLSRASVHGEGLVKRYTQIIEEAGIPHSVVPLELTESAAVYSEEISDITHKLANEGFKLHVDDFGRGYSSLISLNRLPFSTMKIDKSLVGCIDENKGKIIVEQAIMLAKFLNMKIVVEGIETKEQADMVKSMQVDELQGFYYSEALPEDKFTEYVDKYLNVSAEHE